MKPRRPAHLHILFLGSLALLPLASVRAQTTGTWNLTPTTGLTWNTAANWTGLTGGLVPNAIDATPNFTSNITVAKTITLDGDKTVGTLGIDDSGTSFFGFTLNPGTPATSALIFDVSSGSAAIKSETATNTATNTIATPITLMDPLVITSTKTNVNGTLNLNGVITDGAESLGITKLGNGIVQLAGANTYDGGTTITAGRLGAGNATSYGTGSVTVSNGGQAWLSSGATYANNFSLAGNGYANTADAGALNGALRYGGATTSGTINIAADARIGGYNGASGTMAGPLTGSALLEINQAGTSHNGNLILTGSAAGYTGTITVSQGTLRLGTAANLGGSLVAKDGVNLYVENIGTPGAATVGTDSGATRSLTLGNPGSTTTGPNLFIDPSTGDALQVNGDVTLNGTTTVTLAGVIASNPVTVLNYSGTLTGGAANLTLPGGLSNYRPGTQFTTGGGQIKLDLVQGDLKWTGAASNNWNTTEVNWHDGVNPTTFYNLDAVTFDESAAGKAAFTTNLANAAQNDLVFTAVASGAAGELIAVEYVDPSAPSSPLTVGVSGTSITVSLATDADGLITSTANDVKTALTASVPATALITVALAAGNDGTGLVGTLASTTLAMANPTINLATGVTAAPGDMNFSHSAIDYTVSGSGIIGGGGSLTKSGTGTLTLSTANSFTGDVTVEAGILKLGNVAALGAASPKTVTVNDGGRLDFAGISPGATRGYTYKIAGTGGGVGALHNSNAASLASNAGVLNLELLADATVGGSQAAGRFDLGFTNGVSGTITGNNHKLTKVGPNQLQMRGDASGTPIQIEVIEGSLIAENHNNALGGTTGSVSVAYNATVGAYGALTIPTPITLNDNASLTSLNLTGIWTGAVTLAGNAKVSVAGTGVTVQGNIGESAPACVLELSNTSTTADSTITLSGNNSYTGGTTVKGVIAVASSNNAFGTGEVTVQSNGTAARISRVQLGTNVVLPVANSFLLDSDAATGVSAITSFAGDNATVSTAIVNGPVEILKKVGGGGHFASTKGSASVLRVMGPVTSPNGVSVVIRQGTVELGGGGDYAAIEIVDGLLKLAATNGLATSSTLTIGTSGTAGDTGTFDLNGFNQTLGGLLTGARPATVTNNGAAGSTLTLDVAAAATFSGTFADGTSALSLAKTGAGTLTLSGTSNSFAGGLSVTGGGLNLTGTLGGPGSGALMAPGTVLSGEGTFGGDLTLNGATLNVNGSTPLGIFASGNLNVTGGVAVNLQSLPTTPGPIEVIAFGGTLTGNAGNFALVGAANYRTPVFSVAANSVNLTLGAPASLTWTGTGGSDWDINTTSNWQVGGNPSTFLYADNVTFGNSGGGTIGVPANVNASNLVINSNDNWVFQGPGTIAAATVTKDGTGSATFENPVSFAGSVTLTAGVLRLSPPVGATSTVAGAITGAGTLAKGGEGVLSIPSANAGFTGSVVISKGELVPGNSTAFGTASLTFGDATTTAADVCTLTVNTGVALATSQVVVAPTCLDARITGIGGSITGTTITKRGTGSLTIGHPTDYNQAVTYIGGTSAVVIEKGSLAFSSRTALATNTPITLGNANSGDDPTILEVPRAAAADQAVLTPALTLGTLAVGSKSEAIVRYTGISAGSTTTNGAPSVTGTVNLNGRDLFIENISHLTGGTTRLANFQSVISGTGNVHIRCGTNPDGSAHAGPRFRIQSTSNSWTGDLFVDTGYLQIGFTSECVPNNTLLIMSAGTAMGMGNPAETIRGLRGGAATVAVPFTARIENNAGNTNTLRITLSDSNAANTHVYDGRIINSGTGFMALTKAGAATQVINGPCSFTGTTLLTGGKLVLNDAFASEITVSAGATLGGNMTSTAAVTATASGAKVAPGNSTGTMTAASANLSTGGVLELEIDDTSALKNDKLAVTGNLNVTGATLNLTATGTPTQPVYVLASYGTLTGTFGTVTGKPSNYDLVYNYNDGVSTNNIALVSTQTDPYAGWLAAYPALTGASRAPGVDFDGDGLDNGIEFVIGSNPTTFTGPATAGYPAATVGGGNLVFTFKRSNASKTYAVTVETSADLAAWPPAGAYLVPTADTAGPPVTVAGENITVTIPMAPDAKKFARIRADIPFVP